jgi:hypothetical protein
MTEPNPTRTLWVDFNTLDTEYEGRLVSRQSWPEYTPLEIDPPHVGERVLLNDGEGVTAEAVVESMDDGRAVLVVDPYIP